MPVVLIEYRCTDSGTGLYLYLNVVTLKFADSVWGKSNAVFGGFYFFGDADAAHRSIMTNPKVQIGASPDVFYDGDIISDITMDMRLSA